MGEAGKEVAAGGMGSAQPSTMAYFPVLYSGDTQPASSPDHWLGTVAKSSSNEPV